MGSIIRVFARLLQLIAAVLRRRSRRRQSGATTNKARAAKAQASLTAHQQRSVPKGGLNRRERRQRERQHADEVFGPALEAASAKHLTSAMLSADPPPPLPIKEELEMRQRTMPFKVANMENFALTAESAFEHKYNNVMLTVQGRVSKRLSTDTIGNRHQRFVIALPDGQSILVVHNIDDAPRVPLRVGDQLEVRGRYIWNEQGGEMHWTHHDPLGKLAGGYIEMLNTRQRYE